MRYIRIACSQQAILSKLPPYTETESYADLHIIVPPEMREAYERFTAVLESKVQHPTRILTCSTPQGVTHISKHINPDVVLLGDQYSWALDDLKGPDALCVTYVSAGKTSFVYADKLV
jgi:hypothetical protein